MSFFVCDRCRDEGRRSRVRELPKEISSGGVVRYYDEEGQEHIHDGRFNVTPFLCEHGHRWEHRGTNPCPTCGTRVAPNTLDAFGRE